MKILQKIPKIPYFRTRKVARLKGNKPGIISGTTKILSRLNLAFPIYVFWKICNPYYWKTLLDYLIFLFFHAEKDVIKLMFQLTYFKTYSIERRLYQFLFSEWKTFFWRLIRKVPTSVANFNSQTQRVGNTNFLHNTLLYMKMTHSDRSFHSNLTIFLISIHKLNKIRKHWV